MKHREYIRRVAGAKYAVLFIHGIVGTPNHFREAIPLMELVPEDWSVHNMLLPGHGGTVKDFGQSSMKAWRAAARDAFDALAQTHEKVIIVGHSMGTLFALGMAAEHPEKVPALFLMGVPMRPQLAPAAINSSLRLALGKLRPGRPEMAIEAACGTTPTWMLWKYLPWIPRFVELFLQVRRTEQILDQVRVPTIAFQSRKDELVNRASTKVLRRNNCIELRILEQSSHFYYSAEDSQRVIVEFKKLIDTIEKKQHR